MSNLFSKAWLTAQRARIEKQGFVPNGEFSDPMGGMGMPPGGDPSMGMGGGDPSMMGGMPADPSMMGAAPPPAPAAPAAPAGISREEVQQMIQQATGGGMAAAGGKGAGKKADPTVTLLERVLAALGEALDQLQLLTGKPISAAALLQQPSGLDPAATMDAGGGQPAPAAPAGGGGGGGQGALGTIQPIQPALGG